MSNKKQAPTRKGIRAGILSGVVLVGCLLISLAIGIVTGEVAVALLG
jgi:divalent metal cation (Fe/Co/Zn/Cd) transporter